MSEKSSLSSTDKTPVLVIPQPDIPPPPFPILTILATIVTLGVFALMIGMIYYYSKGMDNAVPIITGEQKLAEQKASQLEILSTPSYDKATNAVHIPVDLAVQEMIEQGSKNGKLPFPMKPTAPKEPAKDEPKKQEEKK